MLVNNKRAQTREKSWF